METAASPALSEGLTLLIVGAVAVLTRMSVMFTMLPGVGELAVPARVRIAVVLAVTMALVPVILPQQLAAVQSMDVLALLAFEAFIGFALGFSFRVAVFALSVAGTIIAQSISLSQILGTTLTSEQNPSVSALLVVAGAALFVTFDLHTYSIGLLMESYRLFPLGEIPDSGALAQWATSRTAGAFYFAVSLAIPFLLISFLYYIVLGLMNQAMPQMMVTFIGVPANVLAGLIILAIAVTAILTAWIDHLDIAFMGFW